MGRHASAPSRRRGSLRWLAPVLVGVVVFGAVTAFAASLNVSSKSVGSGNATVSTCNATAAVTYNVAYSASLPGYRVTTAPITTAAACSGLSFRVTLTGPANASLGEVSGTLDATGTASPDFTSANVAAASITGVSVTVTG